MPNNASLTAAARADVRLVREFAALPTTQVTDVELAERVRQHLLAIPVTKCPGQADRHQRLALVLYNLVEGYALPQ